MRSQTLIFFKSNILYQLMIKKNTLILGLSLFLIFLPSSAAKYYLYTGSSNPWGTKGDGTITHVTDITATLNVLAANDSVWIAAGTYTTSGQITLKTGQIIRGGFSGSETNIANRALTDADGNGVVEPWEFANPTIITGTGFSGTSVGYAVLSDTGSANYTLNGITIEGHNTSNTKGGAIYTNSRPAITNCIIRNINHTGGSASIVASGGAGIYSNAQGGATITGCLFENCVTSGYGGGAIYSNCKITVKQSVLRNNYATFKGGAIYLSSTSDPNNITNITNNCIYNNTAGSQGGAINIAAYDAVGPLNVVNNTIVNNVACLTTGGSTGGIIGIMTGTTGTPGTLQKYYNNVIYNNYQNSNFSLGKIRGTQSSVTYDLQYCAYNGGAVVATGSTFATTGNISNLSNPNFVQPSTTKGYTATMPDDVKHANFAIQFNSPLRDMGVLSTTFSVIPSVDLLGNARPDITLGDIGAYESYGESYKPDSALLPTKPDYVQTAIKYFDTAMLGYPDSEITRLIQAMDVGHLVTYPHRLSLMYKATKDVKYLDRAESVVKTMLNAWMIKDSLMKAPTFAITKEITECVKVLKDNGRLGPEYDPIIIKLIDINFSNSEITDHNQIQARVLGAVRAYNLFPTAPNAAKWKAYADTIWNFWYKNRDINESATGYEALDLKDVISMATESGRINLLKTPEIKKWFDRYRDLLSPGGFMPEYGDDYFFAYENYICVFEQVARLFNDPTYLYAAWKLYYTGLANIDPKIGIDAAILTEPVCYAPLNLAPEILTAGSLVTTRNNNTGGKNIPNHLLLGASRKLGVPFVMSEIYARGSHAHTNQLGGINYFEVDNYPLYHGVTRHVWDGRATNTVVVENVETDGFPFSDKLRSLTNTWFTDQLDLAGSPVISSSDSTLRSFKSISFRIANVPQGTETYIDNLRLEGKAGVKMLQTFDTDTAFPNNPNVQLTSDAVNANCIKITQPSNGVYLIWINMTINFSLNDYQYIKLDWKHKAPDNALKQDIEFIVRTESVSTAMGDLANNNSLANAETNVKEEDCFGEIVLNNQFILNTKLTRRMVLTKEGILLLQDYVEPSLEANGMRAGVIWQMYNAPNKQGVNWFNAPSNQSWADITGKPKNKELLVYFDQADGRTFGGQQQDYTINPYTVHAKQIVSTNQPVIFNTLLVPHNPADAVEDIVNSVTSNTLGRNSKVSLTLNGERVSIHINTDKTWSVDRSLTTVAANFANPEIKLFVDNQSMLNIQLRGEIHPVDLEIYSSDGKLFYNKSRMPATDLIKVNVTGLSQGIYICRVISDQGIKVSKFCR